MFRVVNISHSLVASGQLTIAEGLRVQPPKMLWDAIRTTWGKPRVIVFATGFRLAELQDAVGRGARIEDRITRWSHACGFRHKSLPSKYAKDGPLSIDEQSRALLAVSLSKAMVQNDDQGNCRLVKSGSVIIKGVMMWPPVPGLSRLAQLQGCPSNPTESIGGWYEESPYQH